MGINEQNNIGYQMSQNLLQDQVLQSEVQSEERFDTSFLNIGFFIRMIVLYWQWFVFSIIICLSIAAVYLRYTPSVYNVNAKLLVKDGDNMPRSRSMNSIQAAENLGMMTMTNGFDNELEILASKTLAYDAVKELKLYVDYVGEGRVKDRTIYGNLPIRVDMDGKHLENLNTIVEVKVTRTEDGQFSVEGSFTTKDNGKRSFSRKGKLPMSIPTSVGRVSIIPNAQYMSSWEVNNYIKAFICNPRSIAMRYANAIGVAPVSKTTTIAELSLNDVAVDRAIDYLNCLVEKYNLQANEDKNTIARRTELFINDRIKKIDVELGGTDGAIEHFKRGNNIPDATANAAASFTQSDAADNEIKAKNTQILLLESIRDYMNQPQNKYLTLPSNVGLSDAATASLITQYNAIALERQKLLRAASESSPATQIKTTQLDDLYLAIKRSLNHAKRQLEMERQTIYDKYAKYSSQLSQSPSQERVLTEIGREQSVKSNLYIMLLQKREENNISLAATVDKGKMIDVPEYAGKVSPKNMIVFLIAFILGIAIPIAVIILIELLRFRIEGHGDVEKLSVLPIIADIAVANSRHKTKGDIVVHENRNNQMEEIFRGMRTNLQFMLEEGKNVVLFTSSVSGEGKTFVTGNLAVSYALLGKKVVMVGLDIRRPRLASLFEIPKSEKGVTTLLTMQNVMVEDVKDAIVPSGVNKNLDILQAGPIPPNPAELISKNTLDQLFEILRKEYDYVMVDTAPIGIVSDTLPLGRIADVSVIVVRADYTEKSAFKMFNDLASSGKLPHACIAINGIDMSQRKYGYAYGYGRYGKYGKYCGYGKYGNRRYGYGYGYGYGYAYGSYSSSHYGNPDDDSIKTKKGQ